MENPYKKQLAALKKQATQVTVNRAGAPDVIGRVTNVDDDGCALGVTTDESEIIQTVFIAHRDIRGVSSSDWDYDVIS